MSVSLQYYEDPSMIEVKFLVLSSLSMLNWKYRSDLNTLDHLYNEIKKAYFSLAAVSSPFLSTRGGVDSLSPLDIGEYHDHLRDYFTQINFYVCFPTDALITDIITTQQHMHNYILALTTYAKLAPEAAADPSGKLDKELRHSMWALVQNTPIADQVKMYLVG